MTLIRHIAEPVHRSGVITALVLSLQLTDCDEGPTRINRHKQRAGRASRRFGRW
jgi:hypothetical protein